MQPFTTLTGVWDLGRRSPSGTPLTLPGCANPRPSRHAAALARRQRFEDRSVYSRWEVAHTLHNGSVLDRWGVKHQANHQAGIALHHRGFTAPILSTSRVIGLCCVFFWLYVLPPTTLLPSATTAHVAIRSRPPFWNRRWTQSPTNCCRAGLVLSSYHHHRISITWSNIIHQVSVQVAATVFLVNARFVSCSPPQFWTWPGLPGQVIRWPDVGKRLRHGQRPKVSVPCFPGWFSFFFLY